MNSSRGVNKFISVIVKKTTPYSKVEKWILDLIEEYHIDFDKIFYQKKGINNSETDSGESFVIQSILPQIFDSTDPVIFDVGAHEGLFTNQLAKFVKFQKLYAFEPNPVTFEILKNNTEKIDDLMVINAGLGNCKSTKTIYTYKENQTAGHATFYKEILTELHKKNIIDSFQVTVTTVDDFCSERGINYIDFIKIDTEGHEFAILEGAKKFIREDRIKAIQFEFNEMNVISRVFLKDFYEILSGFHIFRINTNKLQYLPDYSPRNEIFQFQNFLAVHKSVDIHQFYKPS